VVVNGRCGIERLGGRGAECTESGIEKTVEVHGEVITFRFEEVGVSEQSEDGEEAAATYEYDVKEIGDRAVDLNVSCVIVEAK
jgi:hypothetical protein